MDYFSILNLTREPFSNSPDPDFFFQSRQHLGCLQKLEIAIRLKRGLSVVIGEVGTGKSTLCRELIRKLSGDAAVSTHLILDPFFPDDRLFLAAVCEALTGKAAREADTPWDLKERIKHHLFDQGVEKGRTTVLIIDEGQKISESCLEFLRELLNYETNEYKLLQIVIFAQSEFADIIARHPNFADRINLYHPLLPLSASDTRQMIRFRLQRSGASGKALNLFTPLALFAIHRATGGYPRRIIHLCHKSLLSMIIQNRSRVGWRIVRACARHQPAFSPRPSKRPWAWQLGWTAAALAAAFLAVQLAGRLPRTETGKASVASVEKAPAPAALAAPAPEVLPAAKPEPVSASEKPVPVAAPSGTPAASAPEPERAPPEAVSPEPAEPFLGTAQVGTGESLGLLSQRVYGAYTTAAVQRILAANPAIKSPDALKVGMPVRFPAVPATVEKPAGERYWVQVARTGTLPAALDLMRSHPPSAPPVRLISFREPGRPFTFCLVLKTAFTDPGKARDQAALVPERAGYDVTVLSRWPDGAVFYADPYWSAS